MSASELRSPVAASFTRAGADETAALVTCAPEDVEALCLLRRTPDGTWAVLGARVAGDPRASWGRCQTVRASSGRSLLLCARASASWGELTQELVALDFALGPDDQATTLVSIRDTTDTACTGALDVLAGSLGDAVVDAGADAGAPRVRVTARQARVRVPPQPPCRNMGAVLAGQPVHVPPPPARRLEFVLRGEALEPSAATAAALREIAALQSQ